HDVCNPIKRSLQLQLAVQLDDWRTKSHRNDPFERFLGLRSSRKPEALLALVFKFAAHARHGAATSGIGRRCDRGATARIFPAPPQRASPTTPPARAYQPRVPPSLWLDFALEFKSGFRRTPSRRHRAGA